MIETLTKLNSSSVIEVILTQVEFRKAPHHLSKSTSERYEGIGRHLVAIKVEFRERSISLERLAEHNTEGIS